MRTYIVLAIVRAPENATVGNDALASGIMGAFEPNDGFEMHSIDVIARDPGDHRSLAWPVEEADERG